jgi:thiol-disulfide isomerase/thioredoxin
VTRTPASRRGVRAALLAALWLAAGLPGLATAAALPAEAPPAASAGDLYALAFADADGKNQPFAQWKGKVLVVNFWATWCAPCVAEMPALEKLQKEYARRGVVIVALGTENGEKVRKFRDQKKLNLPLLAGGFDSMSIARNWGDMQGVLPYTAVFSASGKFLHSQAGPVPMEHLRGWLNAALVDATAHP